MGADATRGRPCGPGCDVPPVAEQLAGTTQRVFTPWPPSNPAHRGREPPSPPTSPRHPACLPLLRDRRRGATALAAGHEVGVPGVGRSQGNGAPALVTLASRATGRNVPIFSQESGPPGTIEPPRVGRVAGQRPGDTEGRQRWTSRERGASRCWVSSPAWPSSPPVRRAAGGREQPRQRVGEGRSDERRQQRDAVGQVQSRPRRRTSS